jgi:hypothetical protein
VVPGSKSRTCVASKPLKMIHILSRKRFRSALADDLKAAVSKAAMPSRTLGLGTGSKTWTPFGSC